jgi:hypothetical protein
MLAGGFGCAIATDECGYALRRDSEAHTRPRNWSGVSVGGAAVGFGSTTAGAEAFVAFFAALRAASRASCLVANSFASVSIISFGEARVRLGLIEACSFHRVDFFGQASRRRANGLLSGNQMTGLYRLALDLDLDTGVQRLGVEVLSSLSAKHRCGQRIAREGE